MKKKTSETLIPEAQITDDMMVWEEGQEDLAEASEKRIEFAEENSVDDIEVEAMEEETSSAEEVSVEGTELADFEAAEIEDVQFVSDDQLISVLESVLFATDKPVSVAFLRQVFKGTNIRSKDIRAGLEKLASELASGVRGVTLEEVGAGYQLRTKIDNVAFLKQAVKARPFKLSGPALEVLSIVAYKQPVTKAQIDEIRGVESGHLLRALMEKSLLGFGEKSELPGKPMYYETTRKFLEIFGLRNIRELPSISEIDQLIPEGIGDEKKETLGDLTDQLSQEAGVSYSQGEEELLKITDELSQISTSSEFFEQEKRRLRDKRDSERAQDIREAIALGEQVDEKELRWLERYDEAQILKQKGEAEVNFVVSEMAEEAGETTAPTDADIHELTDSDDSSEPEPSLEV